MSVSGTLSSVFAHYSVGECQAFTKIEQGYVNETWRVKTSTGFYLLKRRHPNFSRLEVVTAQHSLLEFLHQNRFPVPAFIRTNCNSTFLSLDQRIYELQEYIPGILCDRTMPRHIECAAHTLGHYHDLVKTFDDPVLHRSQPRYHPEVLWQIINQLITVKMNKISEQQILIVQRFDGHLQRLSNYLKEFDEFPHLVIHGDYHAGNITLKNGIVNGVFDFDNAHWNARIQEVAEATIYFAQEPKKRFEHIVYSGVLELDIVHSFLATYAEVITLTRAEIIALPHLIRATWLCAALAPPLHPRLHLDTDIEALQETLKLSDWAEKHADEITRIGMAVYKN